MPPLPLDYARLRLQRWIPTEISEGPCFEDAHLFEPGDRRAPKLIRLRNPVAGAQALHRRVDLVAKSDGARIADHSPIAGLASHVVRLETAPSRGMRLS